ncbi:MAG TPA: pyridoxamine 5'-phosphate oxidase family protein [Terriglobales bacterium]|nr:pyridoxamine 5'-phosphate oxidase family protein [Terriglobales bacterium]
MAETSNAIARLNELISGIETAILTTVHPDGSLHSTPMAAHIADEFGVLWFITKSNTEKVEAIRTSQHVNVAFADHAARRYVSVNGYCELVRDRARATTLWQPAYASWLPGGLDDPALILLKVDIRGAEYWDAATGHMAPLLGLSHPS